MTNDVVLTEEEMVVDEGLGYPKAYAKLCRDRSFGPFSHGPPFTYTPYVLVEQEDLRAKELDEMFPIMDPKAKPTTRPKIFASLLWKQLNHLGNAGFDPETFRVDQYGNVLYFHADAASPLAWDMDHWFPCTRGGLTVPSNLRILQWQVCKRKHNKLEFLIPWWDFQLGISINQFLSIFAASNSDFRHRAFSWLFQEGESEELNASQTVDSHTFPQHFVESKRKLGMAPAAVVLSRRESFDAPLKSQDANRRPRSSTPIIAAKKMKRISKENEDPLMASNPYQAIVMARDSLKQREETVKMQTEIQKLDNEVSEWQQMTEEEKVSIQDLELMLVKKRRRAEKCRRLAESQSSYRAMLEKMIRDAMHQSVVYKEQVRLNQAASNALMARLEAQKAICDSAERELHRKYKYRDELEKQTLPLLDQARKRSRMDENPLNEEQDDKIALCLPSNEPKLQEEIETNYSSLVAKETNKIIQHKELRKFLEEEQGASEERSVQNEQLKQKEIIEEEDTGYIIEERLEKLEMKDAAKIYNLEFPCYRKIEEEEDEESRKQRGKGNIEKWMQFLLENTPEYDELNPPSNEEMEIIRTVDFVKNQESECMEKDNRLENATSDNEKEEAEKNVVGNATSQFKNPPYRIEPEKVKAKEPVSVSKEARRISISDDYVKREKIGKGKELKRSESARAFRRIPSSPSLILEGMKKRVDCIRRKPLVLDDNEGGDDEERKAGNSFMRSSIKSIKRAVGI